MSYTFEHETTVGEGRAIVTCVCKVCEIYGDMELDKVLMDGNDIYMALTEDTINDLEMECIHARDNQKEEV